MSLSTVLGQPSWRLANSSTEAFVTETGGHIAPVRVRFGDRTVEPFSVAPWATEPLTPTPNAMIRTLRGDFFCLPFGGNDTPYEREFHRQHGDTANLKWQLEKLTGESIHLSMNTEIRPGRVDKKISLDGTTIYQTHTISGMTGPMTIGHHAMLKFPAEGHVSTSAILGGRVFPDAFERPDHGGYSSLLPGGDFHDLSRVPMINGALADLTRYPAREGFEDLVQVYHPQDTPFAWNAVVVDGWIWFSLKDPRVLPATVLWHSNGGRHYAPWSGRHRGILGIEDVCAYFHYGLAESAAPNSAPVPTVVHLNPEVQTVVKMVMAVIPAPKGFGRVVSIQPSGDGVTLIDADGRSAKAAVDLDFIITA